MNPLISAIICTYNRQEYLPKAIDSLLAQDCSSYEIIVVDNGSTDTTRSIVQSYPNVIYIYEPTMGLSVARNTGASIAKADILAYLDDDAIASHTWLSTLLSAYQSNDKLAIAGGQVTLIWPKGISPPNWISDILASNLGLYYLGDQIIHIHEPSLTPRGLNYSIRRQFLNQIKGFNPLLGRIGKNLLSNEELYTTQQALELGWQVAYLPLALVQHHVAPERISKSWFLSRGWWQGVSEYYREQLKNNQRPKYEASLERLLRGCYKVLKYYSNPAIRFENLVYIYCQIGYLKTAFFNQIKRRQPQK